MKKRVWFYIIGILMISCLGSYGDKQAVVNGTSELPMKLDHGRITVDVEIIRPNGVKKLARAWVDLGGTSVIMAETLARELGLDLSAMPSEKGHSYTTKLPVPTLKLGGKALDADGMMLSIFPGRYSRPGVQSECTLPARCLRNLHLIFDYPEGKLIVAKPGVIKPLGTVVPIKIHPDTGLCMIEATMEGEKVFLGLDTGSAGTWVSDKLTSVWLSRHTDWPRLTGAAGSTNFFGFPFETQGQLVVLSDLTLAANLDTGETAVLGLDQSMFDWYSKKSAAPVQGFLGGDLLSRFRIEVDFSARKSWWQAGKPPLRRDLDIVPISLRNEADGSFYVAGVVKKDGKPFFADILPGDKLLAVNERVVSKAPMGTIIDALRGRPGETRTLRLERGGKEWLAGARVEGLGGGASAATDDPMVSLEQRLGGRLGVAALDTGSGKVFVYRGDERFPMASTFKLMLAAAVLSRVDRGEEQLERLVPYTAEDLLDWAPVTRARISEKALSIRDLCAAIILESDNTAANLLLKTLGGPAGLTAYARSIGDSVFRLDRDEPTLNEAAPGDERDTTSPAAMLATMKKLLIGDGLTGRSRGLLVDWMKGCVTGKKRLRAATPADWEAGDKTGTGYNGSSNDLAIFWPPKRAPIMIVAYSTGSSLSGPDLETILADVGRRVIHFFSQETGSVQ